MYFGTPKLLPPDSQTFKHLSSVPDLRLRHVEDFLLFFCFLFDVTGQEKGSSIHPPFLVKFSVMAKEEAGAEACRQQRCSGEDCKNSSEQFNGAQRG